MHRPSHASFDPFSMGVENDKLIVSGKILNIEMREDRFLNQSA
jgi:hypothetical protein